MRSSNGCENCAVRGMVTMRTINEASQAGVYVLTSLTGGEQQLVKPGAGKVCAGSTLKDGEVPVFDALVRAGDRVDVTTDRLGVAQKIGPVAVNGGHVCVLLDPFRQGNVEGLVMPDLMPAHA